MYNAEKPSPEELPSTAQLLRSTAISVAAAVFILITIILPAEYAIDPTRIGRLLGLTEMGEIKQQLADEAERDRSSSLSQDPGALVTAGLFGSAVSTLLTSVFGALVDEAHAQETQGEWRDELSFTLAPGEGIEWKLMMNAGDIAQFRWETAGGRINFSLHGDGTGPDSGEKTTYEEGRGSTSESGEIVAAFTGAHGWFWRNRDRQDVTVTLRLDGTYSELKRTY
ncbi:transmembrane anchor protein [Pyruvatibacter mobilis]|jgi:hypothetical protein|uniref:Transmembrane anchor protein n=1 Tax=Pyruvatibacter mobilis TaxID=1712261 RepID=A0A845Q5K2_9HYPH|nr:transmembrane anchor protein [Pyruvatibacter mobilis]NBG94158.1 transmembrane anchor protein [Pyruvatibacter mobilis]QJD76468.1 transmembrane anchor protein [Pyruvatibacter mobilis]GGD00814.1 hypothetical protein GCM10011587_00520 [Pyruvatibacter mobilis]